ncbi:hypothetical protein TWF192_001195 [Orbilia oligospora]|uniref:Hypervirulence associated protein TUDOR domain-containing protein n=1 Tax=Orbilia oligospora TaxID=2813651 RepID=A0A6G1LUX3_ORBOL|nr:hypothetical protein TWF679_000780 [Orbilia oligospora]KAF3213937.1 hypothetical protein TWF191_009935 [Orbilia oligospora]KAF3234815.1 hypothetical protein TWF192_001195 [Orbilia oligospora]
MPYPAQWNWGQGHPSGTVTEVADHGSLSIQSSNGNTITRNAEPSNPAVHLQQDSGTDVVKRASELEIKSSSDDNKDDGADDGDGNDGKPRKPFPPPRQSAPISRPPDTAQEQEEANLSIEEQVKLAEERDEQAEKKDGDDIDIDSGSGENTTTTIHGHTNGDETATTQPSEQLMDLREEVQEKPTKPEASVGEKRGRSEEPTTTTVASDEQQKQQDHTSGSPEKNGGDKNDSQEEVPEPESKKPRVEESNKEVTDPTAPASTELDQSKPVETAEAPKKKAGRPKKEETKAVTGERKNSVSSRTRSKANAEDVSI